MTDMLPDDAWVNAFLSTPPRPLLTALERRLHTSTTHLNAVAEIYKQRAIIESTYADSLAKLAKTAEQGGLSGKSGNEWEKASGEGRLWAALISELAETSASHSTLSALLKTDFEQPLREMPTKIVAWRRIGEQDASLDKTLKDYEKTSAKLEKASSKSKSSKADTLQSELNQLTSSLSSLSPMVYTTYQRVDEERLRSLKEVVVRWGTVRGDIAARDGQRAEGIVATLLSWETVDEVLNVGRKLGSVGGARVPDSAMTTPRSNRRLSSVTATTNNDFSPRPQPRTNGSSSNLSNPPSTFGGGFKSMLGRTKTMGGGRTRSGSNATSTRSGRDRDGAFETIGEDAPRTGSAPPVDDEGFSVAPSDRHRNPWEDPNELIPAPAGHTYTPNVTASPAASQESLPTPHLNLAIAPQPIQETDEERQAALQRMQQTLQMAPSQPSRRSTIARGRRDVRNTMFAGTPVGENGTLSGLTLGKVTEPEEQLADSPIGTAETPAVVRQTSLSSINPFDSPGLMSAPSSAQVIATSPGLRASLHEAVNVIIKDKEIQRIQITGEIHLSLLPSQQVPTGPIHIRLTQFERLEKIAPNPAYLAQVPDRPGEYFLNSENLAAATQRGTDKGTLLFKYVVHVQPGKELSTAPLILEPAFLCKDGETRMILHYRVNEATSLQLGNVAIVASFGPGPSVTNVQAKPAGGVWSPSTRRMQWKLDQLPSAEGKIIAKFVTEPGEAMSPQGVQATWGAEGTLLSGLGVEVVGGELEGHEWAFEDVRKSVVAGKYLAEPSISGSRRPAGGQEGTPVSPRTPPPDLIAKLLSEPSSFPVDTASLPPRTPYDRSLSTANTDISMVNHYPRSLDSLSISTGWRAHTEAEDVPRTDSPQGTIRDETNPHDASHTHKDHVVQPHATFFHRPGSLPPFLPLPPSPKPIEPLPIASPPSSVPESQGTAKADVPFMPFSHPHVVLAPVPASTHSATTQNDLIPAALFVHSHPHIVLAPDSVHNDPRGKLIIACGDHRWRLSSYHLERDSVLVRHLLTSSLKECSITLQVPTDNTRAVDIYLAAITTHEEDFVRHLTRPELYEAFLKLCDFFESPRAQGVDPFATCGDGISLFLQPRGMT